MALFYHHAPVTSSLLLAGRIQSASPRAITSHIPPLPEPSLGGTLVQQPPHPPGAGLGDRSPLGERFGRVPRRRELRTVRHVHSGGRELPQAGEVPGGC